MAEEISSVSTIESAKNEMEAQQEEKEMSRGSRYYMLHREERLTKQKEYYKQRADVIQRREEKEKKRAEKEAAKEALKEQKRLEKEQKVLERLEKAKATARPREDNLKSS